MLKSWLFVAFGVLFASNVVPGISYESGEALVVVALLLSACNVFLKPLIMLLSLPLIILTFGIGIWIINALLFWSVGGLVGGFHIDSFGSALWGALVVSITSGVASLLFGSPNQRRRVNVNVGVGPQPSAGPHARRANQPRRPKPVIENDDDVIDI